PNDDKDRYNVEHEHYGDTGTTQHRKFVSAMECYAYELQIRPHFTNPLLRSGWLFHQYIVDMMHGDNNPSHIGHRILLPASFIGSPRDMIQQYQDAMALLRAGKPDLFITMTCNPNWMEIQAGQKAQDQPDITETGSSYAYILVILHPEDKSQTPDGYDDIVCAEIPDPVINPRVHATIIDSMFHGPCGMLNPNAPCMVDDGIGHKNSNKSWKKHQCGGCIGRMYMAHPGEVMGARSFEELRVVDGIACAIFKESAQHRVFGDVSDVHQLWIENFDAMVEDFAHNEIPE
ncbi:12231_t:CDS:2, partial [Entrophospora sp. SA101]